MAYRMLFTDLDGTLLNRRSALTDGNKRAIRAAVKAGKQIVICSGRSWWSLDYYERSLGLDRSAGYGAAFNGGVVYETHTKKFLSEQTMAPALAHDIINALKALGAVVLVYAGNRLTVERKTKATIDYAEWRSFTDIAYVEDFSEINERIYKVLTFGPHERLAEIESPMAAKLAGRAAMFFSADELLEFCHPAAHKGHAVLFLAEYLHIPVEEIIAVGDQANDITMIQTAGLGVAVANAIPEVKAAARKVLPYSCDEDAVARLIHEYLL